MGEYGTQEAAHILGLGDHILQHAVDVGRFSPSVRKAAWSGYRHLWSDADVMALYALKQLGLIGAKVGGAYVGDPRMDEVWEVIHDDPTPGLVLVWHTGPELPRQPGGGAPNVTIIDVVTPDEASAFLVMPGVLRVVPLASVEMIRAITDTPCSS